jgi:hypothetical protein
MTFELAKQLKDAGFPQELGGRINEVYLWVTEKHYVENETPVYRPPHWKRLYARSAHAFVNEWMKIPTLFELIEACGHDCFKLQLGAGGQWFSFGERGIDRVGDNPEEAVAKLWLSLNHK